MKVIYSFIKDLKVSFKTFYVYIEIVMALIFVAVLLFVVPENFSSNSKLYIHVSQDLRNSTMYKELLETADENIVNLENSNDIKSKMEEDRNSVGVEIQMEDNKLSYNITLQGYENGKFRNLIEKAIIADFAKELPGFENTTNLITLDNASERLSDRLNILPVYLLLNSSFVGLFIVATYIFMDKEEGTIRAIAVTPSKMWEYLLSKMGVMMLTGLLTALLTAISIAGLKPNYVHLIMLLISTNAFGTALGLFISSFYDDIIKAMGSIFVTIIAFGFATVSYYVPGFSPLLIKILPSYPMLFAFREVFLESPNLSYVYLNVVGFGILAVLIFIWANHRFKKTLTA